jgi:hypothetical protein
MPPSRDQLYAYHLANFRAVGGALRQVGRSVKEAIRRDSEAGTLSLTRVYAMLTTAEIECRLLQLAHEKAVPDAASGAILRERAQVDRWLTTIDVGFRRRYHVGFEVDLDTALDFTARQRRVALRDVVETDLRPLIELRNSLAHGQWVYAVANDLKAINPSLMTSLKNENFRSLDHKREISSALAHALRDLLVSGPTFARDFDGHYAQVERHRKQLAKEDYNGYVTFLRKRHARRSRYVGT